MGSITDIVCRLVGNERGAEEEKFSALLLGLRVCVRTI